MENIISKLKELGVYKAFNIEVCNIDFIPELRIGCEKNYCGNFGRNYMCPPFIGEIDALIKKAQTYKNAILFQKIYKLEDSYDIENMMAGQKDFTQIGDNITLFMDQYDKEYFIIDAGGCSICEKCMAISNEPCVCPEKARASLEGYGVQVSQLAKKCDMNYINGENTVTYFGAIFVK